jgi:regulator of protease activity HflC (stomatin/prohibitin superfamily)
MGWRRLRDMRTRYYLLVLVVLVFVLTLFLYFVLDARFIWAFVGAFIGSAITGLALFKKVEVEAYQRLIVRRAGELRDPGVQGGRLFLIRPFEEPILVDMRPRPRSEEIVRCFTKEGVGLDIGYSLQWQVVDPLRFLTNSPGLENTPIALGQMATPALRDAVGQFGLQDVLLRGQGVAQAFTSSLRGLPQATNWGMEVVEVNLGDTKVPPSVAEAIARQAAADLTAQARQGEVRDAAQALDQMLAMLNNPAVLDRAVLLQIARSLADALAQRR